MSDTDRSIHEITADHLNSFAIHFLRSLRSVDQRADLARIEEVRRPTMSGIVDGMEEAGLARRLPHPSSARLIRIEATEKGRRIMDAARQARLQVIAEGLSHLDSPVREAIIAVAPHLHTIVDAIRTLESANARERFDEQT